MIDRWLGRNLWWRRLHAGSPGSSPPPIRGRKTSWRAGGREGADNPDLGGAPIAGAALVPAGGRPLFPRAAADEAVDERAVSHWALARPSTGNESRAAHLALPLRIRGDRDDAAAADGPVECENPTDPKAWHGASVGLFQIVLTVSVLVERFLALLTRSAPPVGGWMPRLRSGGSWRWRCWKPRIGSAKTWGTSCTTGSASRSPGRCCAAMWRRRSSARRTSASHLRAIAELLNDSLSQVHDLARPEPGRPRAGRSGPRDEGSGAAGA